MNLYSIWQRVNRRLPAYDPSELYDEINDAYQECWDAILKLDDSYFTDIKVVTVAQTGIEFDFLYNSNGNLTAPVSNRYFQIDRIRILQPNDSNWIPALPRNWNDPEYLTMIQTTPQTAATNSPYRYIPFANGAVQFAKPFNAGVQIEVVYTFVFLPLQITAAGTITSSTNVVTGSGSSFTSLLGADYQLGFPGNDEDTDVGIELVLTGNQTYRVKTLTSDTALTTINVINPALGSATNYQLAMVPDIPMGHHDVIATIATRNVMSTPGNDSRLPYWSARASEQLDAMRDTIMSRQRQEPPRRRRFSQSVLRYFVPGVSR